MKDCVLEWDFRSKAQLVGLMKNLMKRAVALFAIPAILLCGCGKGEAPIANSETKTEAAVNWKEDGFTAADMSGEKIEENLLNVQGFQKWEADDGAEWGIVSSGTVENYFWRLCLRLDEEGVYCTGKTALYRYEKYDTDSGATENISFTPEDFGLDDEIGYVEGMSVGTDGFCILRWVPYAIDEDGLYIQSSDQMILTDFGDNCKILDFYDLFLEKEIETVLPYVLPMWNALQCGVDKDGNIYVLSGGDGSGSNLYVFDYNKQQLMEFQSSRQEQLLQLIMTDTGEYIAVTNDVSRGKYKFLWVDAEHGVLKELCALSDSSADIDKVLGLWGNDIFYIGKGDAAAGNAGKLVKWNIGTGGEEIVVDFSSAGVDTANFAVELVRDDRSGIWLCLNGRSGLNRDFWISRLSTEPAAAVGNVVVADLMGDGGLLARCALQAQMSSPNFKYDYTDASDKAEKERIELELVQQNGPDILYVSYEDMYNYAQKGLLSDMSEFVGEGIREKILPGAIGVGTIDGKMYGLPLGVVAKTFVAAADREIPSAWNMESLLELIKTGDLSGEIRSPYVFGGAMPPAMVVQELTRYNLQDSAGYFEEEGFVELLDTVRSGKVQTLPDEWFEDPADLCWGYLTAYADFISLFDHIEYENGRIAGYPTGDGGVGYLVPSGGMVVVNSNTKNQEAVSEFLAILFGEEMQKSAGRDSLGICKITPSDYYTEDETGKLYFMGNKSIEVTLFDDGSNSMERAAEFLNHCGGQPYEDRRISAIVYEEVCSMLESGMTSEETAGIISNRVQLYLDE